MYFHIYNDVYIYKNQTKEIILSKNQFLILSTYIELNDLYLTVKELIGDQIVDDHQFNLIQNNVSNFISYFEDETKENLQQNKIVVTGEYGKTYPRVFNIELTNHCNLFCSHCYKEAEEKKDCYLSIDIINYICEKYKGKIQLVNLTGGEPLSHPYICEIIDLLYENGFVINITTNGTLYEKIIDRLYKVNNFQISIYGFDEHTYLRTTTKREFSKMNSFIRILENSKKEFSISFLANRLYLNNYEEYNNYLKSIKTDIKIIGVADVQGRCTKNGIWYLSEKEKEYVYSLLNDVKELSPDEVDNDKHCNAGTLAYTINEHGKVLLCQALNNDIFAIGSFENLEKRFSNNNFNMYEYAKKYAKLLGKMCKFSEG